MQHLEDGYLHEIADGEVPSADLVAVREHLDACESCRARLDQARMEAETARELVELIDVPEPVIPGAIAEGSVAMFAPLRMREVSFDASTGNLNAPEPPRQETPRQKGLRWVRPLAWAASLVLAAGIGYMGRSQVDGLLSTPVEPTSIGRIDAAPLEFPAPTAQPESIESDALVRDALNRRQDAAAAAPPAENPRSEPAPPARQNAAVARAEEEQAGKRRAGLDTVARLDEVVATKAAEKKVESTDAVTKQPESIRERVANDARDQATQLRVNRAQPAAPPVAGASAESRLMAKSAADAAPTIISFPRAVELLGGRIKLIEGMVPARLEAVGRTVRVIYIIDEGALVLAQVAATDTLHWNLSGPLAADSLASLQRRIK
jgi:hypothetical protein